MVSVELCPFKVIRNIGIVALLSCPAKKELCSGDIVLYGGGFVSAGFQLVPKCYNVLSLGLSNAVKREVVKELS